MSRSDYTSSTCTVSGQSNLHPLRAEQLIGKMIERVVADEYRLSLVFTDGTMVYAEGHTMSDSALDVSICSDDGISHVPLVVELFLLKYPALKSLSDCLTHTCRVLIEAANALEDSHDAKLKKVAGDALRMAKKSAKTQARCNEVAECEARAMLKGQLIRIWPVMYELSRQLPNETSSDAELVEKVLNAIKVLNDPMVVDTSQQEEQE